MKFIDGTTTDGKRELIALDKVVSITGHGENTKILTGAGLYWFFIPGTIEITDFSDRKIEEVLNHGKQ